MSVRGESRARGMGSETGVAVARVCASTRTETVTRRVFIKFKYLALVNQISASKKSFIVELKVVLTNRVDLFEKTDP